MTATVTCPDCGAAMIFRNSRFGPFYGCADYPTCQGLRKANAAGVVHGPPKTKAVRQAQRKAHDVFDRIWKTRRMKRSEAYGWLFRAMDLPLRCHAHINLLGRHACLRLMAKVASEFPDLVPDVERKWIDGQLDMWEGEPDLNFFEYADDGRAEG